MKILVITGSPHKKGASALLAESFIDGATSAGHEVVRFDAASEQVKPCLGCYYCLEHEGTCVHGDAMEKLYPDLVSAEMIVFASPVYYFGFTAQIKAVIDRFFARGSALVSPKKAALLVTCEDTDVTVADPMIANYRMICRFHGWEDCGYILGSGIAKREDLEATDLPKRAYFFGVKL